MKRDKAKKAVAISFALIIVLFASLNQSSVLAYNSKTIENSFYELAANVPGFEKWVDAQYTDVALLKVDNDIFYTLYTVESSKDESCGYFICDASGSIIEFSRNTSPYDKVLKTLSSKECKTENTILLYQPGFHGVLQSDGTVELVCGDNSNCERYDDMNSPSKGNDLEFNMISGVPDYPNTVSCIPTAIGNVIGYWDSHGYPNLVTTSTSSFISEISSYMTSNTANTYIPTAVHTYCHQSGRYPNNFTATNIWSPTYAQFRAEINAGRPCLVGFSSGGYYSGAHMTCGVGYYYVVSTTTEYLYVHDANSMTAFDFFVQWTSHNDFIGRIVP